MRILLINPPWVKRERNVWRNVASIMPPLGLAWIAAVLERDRHEVLVLDAHAERLTLSQVPARLRELGRFRIVGITATTALAANATERGMTLYGIKNCDTVKKSRAWFAGRGWAPRAHQLEMVEAGRAGQDTLLIAPTGGGKTLDLIVPFPDTETAVLAVSKMIVEGNIFPVAVEFMDRIIPGMDGALSKELTKVLKKQGMKFYTSHKVQSVERAGDVVTVKAENAKGEIITLEGDYSLVSVGRRPYTDGLNAEKAGVKVTDRGQIEVNDHLQTSASNIYAIGDVVRGAMLAHKAEEEGVLVAEILAGQKPHIDYNLIPGVVYTWPEVAAVGKTEEQLKADGVAYKAGSFPFKALGRARAGGDTDGFVKILADAKTDEVLGVHMIGARCADLIAEAVTAMEFRASAEDISRMSHAHPTFAEAIKEAALAATDNRALHV